MNFETKLKENLIKDVDATNKDVIDDVMKTPFTEVEPKRGFFNMPKRAVATICASVLLLCVGIFASDSLASQDSAQPMPMSMPEVSRAIESDIINISESLQSVLLEAEMEEVIAVAVYSNYSSEDFMALVNLNKELTFDDFANLESMSVNEILYVEIEKASIINMKDYFYFMLPSEV